ncbi:MAG: Acetophenone carboxylase delta subunit, partial [Alphaproteobacteria bacterium MarineAlpha10_Bin1]
MSVNKDGYTLDPVTFEVLKNSYVNIVDQMAEQIFRTCYSFVIWSRDFSSAICDTEGNTVMQGSGDIAAHVGTLHFTAQAVINKFGDDIHPGDTFVTNDVYQGGTHFNDTRIVRPIFYHDIHLGFAQANGHWADVGGAVPGSFNVNALDHMAEGLRITPVRVFSKGVYLSDVAELIANNTRAPDDIIGDLQAQAEACNLAEKEICRLCDKYGVDVIQTSFAEVQDYVETMDRFSKKLAIVDNSYGHTAGLAHQHGASSYITGVGAFWPQGEAEFWALLEAGKYAEADRLHSRQSTFWRLVDEDFGGFATNVLKAAAEYGGIEAGSVRPPFHDLTADEKARLA